MNIAFFAIFTYSVLSIALRPQPYTRPLGFFVSVGVLASLLAVESIRLPARHGYEYGVLVKIILIGILLRWVPQMMFPGGIWLDPWAHESIVQEILNTFHIPEMGVLSYSRFPVMHLEQATTMLVTGMDFETSFMLLVSSLQVVVQALFTYLLAVRVITGKSIALLAALLVTVADVVVAKGTLAYPTTLAVVLLTAIVYAIFRARQISSARWTALSLCLMATLIVTHTVVSFAASVLLLCFWLGIRVYQKLHRLPETFPPLAFSLVVLFAVAMLSWWMYASGHIALVAKAIRWALQSEYYHAPAPEEALAYASGIPVSEVLMDRAGFSLYYAFATMGCLYLVSRRSAGRGRGFALALGGVVFAAIGFIAPVLDLYVLPTRWYFMSQVALVIPATLGIVLLVDVAGRHKAVLLGALIGLMTFSMIADATANFDTEIFSSTRLVRRAFIESELQSMDTITDLWDGTIASDQHANSYLTFENRIETVQITEPLAERDFQSLEGVAILIRDYITSNPFHARAIWMLDYDPRDLLRRQGFGQLYDSGAVSLHYR